LNIVEPILFQAKVQPEAPALCAQGVDVISYGLLAAQMSLIAHRAASLGLKAKDVVALSVDEPLLHAVIILGLTQAGIITLSVAGHPPPPGVKVDAVVSSRPYRFALEAKHFVLDMTWMTGDPAPIATTPFGSEASDKPCRIVLTSGTTGEPKAVALSHAIVAARNARFEFVLGSRLPLISRLYMNTALASAFGFQYLIQMLSRGGTLFFRGDTIPNTLRAFAIYRIEAMVATPATLSQFLDACDRHSVNDVRVDTILTSGSLLPRPLLERIRPRLCSHVITGYGATETAVSVTAPAHRIADIPGAAGYVTPGIRIEIVDEADRALPVGTEGIVRIASELGVNSYIGDPVETARVFRDGWFYPGDLGHLTADNLLVISGRQNEMLNVGGGKIPAEKVEEALMNYEGVREAVAFMATSAVGTDEVWAAVVASEPVDVDKLRAHCSELIPIIFVPAHVVPLERLPMNANGKIDRPQLKQMLLAEGRR
jgi:acyl-CoA synthetase (AMP-forming)/AMP-acid ligase II